MPKGIKISLSLKTPVTSDNGEHIVGNRISMNIIGKRRVPKDFCAESASKSENLKQHLNLNHLNTSATL